MQQHQPQISPDHDGDFFAWTQHQAKLLRAISSSVAELPTGIDLHHLAEEIDDLGKAELRGATRLIRQIFIHLIKAASDPKPEAINHWRTEATNFSLDLPDYYSRSMRRLIDMQDLWMRARKAAEVSLREHGSSVTPDLPAECPFTLDDIVSDRFDFDAALKNLTPNSKR